MSCVKSLLAGVPALVAAALLAACASAPAAQGYAAERASYMAHAGKPVDRLVWTTNYRRLAAISSDQLVVWTGLEQPYLVTVRHPCANLWFANHLGLTQTGDSVYTRANLVKADGWTCAIKTIQPVDYRQMQQDQRRQANASGG
jgi:hypothetical protein